MATYKHEDKREVIKDLYLNGYTKQAISERVGISCNQVAYILYKLLNLKIKAPRKETKTNLIEALPKQLVNRVITLANWGYNSKEIAEDINQPFKRVNYLVKEATRKDLIKKMV
jgi:hypothetical protein